jgi:hypothetical protein
MILMLREEAFFCAPRGARINGTDVVGTIRRLRVNFDEYAVLGKQQLND